MGTRRCTCGGIEPPLPDSDDFDGAGMWINAAQEGFAVTAVAEPSPAAEAGLHAGDVILELAGRRAGGLDLSDARELLRMQRPGTRVDMVVKGKSATRHVVVTLRDLI